ncbi:hypothetical protein AGMMS49525_15200 [Bacteroidia bacterium]|nr:hypothetical protein AGMMS49525_15200 [Bacteroidia bacterium]
MNFDSSGNVALDVTALDGTLMTNLDASKLTTGTVPVARLPLANSTDKGALAADLYKILYKHPRPSRSLDTTDTDCQAVFAAYAYAAIPNNSLRYYGLEGGTYFNWNFVHALNSSIGMRVPTIGELTFLWRSVPTKSQLGNYYWSSDVIHTGGGNRVRVLYGGQHVADQFVPFSTGDCYPYTGELSERLATACVGEL